MQQNVSDTLNALTTEDLAGMNLELDQIWYLKSPGSEERMGPFSEPQLKDFLNQNPQFDTQTLACSEANEDWIPIFDIPVFQRRKPQLVAIQTNNANTHYHILVKGQKQGPFTLKDIGEKLKKKEMLYNDFVSPDKGYNWYKLFELPDFDRRDQLEAVLPVAPSEETFGHSKVESIRTIDDNQDTKEIIAMIATSGRRKMEDYNHTEPSANSEEEWWKNKKVVGSMFAVVLTLSVSIWGMKGKKNGAKEDVVETDFEQVQTVPQVARVPNFGAAAMKRKPASRNNSLNRGLNNPYGGIQPRSLNQISRAHNVPVPINDAQPVNYDDPPADYHDMAEPNEQVMNGNAGIAKAMPVGQDQAYEGGEPMPAEPIDNPADRVPAGNEGYDAGAEPPPEGEALPPQPSPAAQNMQEQEIFNQEVEN